MRDSQKHLHEAFDYFSTKGPGRVTFVGREAFIFLHVNVISIFLPSGYFDLLLVRYQSFHSQYYII